MPRRGPGTVIGQDAKLRFRRLQERLGDPLLTVVCTENLNPDVVVMKSAKDRMCTNDAGPLNRARDRCIFI